MSSRNNLSAKSLQTAFIETLKSRKVISTQIDAVLWIESSSKSDRKQLQAIEKHVLGSKKTTELVALKALADRELTLIMGLFAASTQAVVLSGYRRAIAANFNEHPIIPMMKLSKSEYEEIKQATKKRSNTARSEHRIEFSLGRLNEYRKLARDLLASNSYIDRIVGLMMATGRRPYEIVSTATFEPALATDVININNVDNSHWVSIPLYEQRYQDAVRFTGKAKVKRFQYGTFVENDTHEQLIIPTLLPAHEVINGLNSLRCFDSVQEMNNPNSDFSKKDSVLNPTHSSKVHSRISKPLNAKFKRHLQDFYGNSKPYTARHVYAKLTGVLFEVKDEIKQPFAGAILGHENGDETTALYYDTVNIVD